MLVAGDLGVEKNCEDAVLKTVDKFTRINVLVTSAGILLTGSIETTSLEDYDRLMNINCRSILHMMKLCTPHLIETKGNIVNVSSVTGLRAVSHLQSIQKHNVLVCKILL